MAVGKGPAPPKGPKVDLDDLVRRWEADKKSRLFLQLADEYRRQDQLDAAISVLNEGMKVHAAFVPAHVALARCLMAKGQLAQAQAELEPIHKKSPDNMLAGKLLAEVLAERGERQRALVVLKALQPFAIQDPEVDERIAEIEAALATPSMARGSSTATGDTAEFATGDFARTTGNMVLGSQPAGQPLAPTPVPPSRPTLVTTPPPQDEAEDIIVIDAGEADEVPAAGEPLEEEAIVVEEEEALPPMPRPAESPLDLLGEPRPSRPAALAPEQDDFTSITLAELHESQGAFDQAAALYSQLLARKPDDASLKKALDRCQARLAGADVAAPIIEAVATPPPSITRPRWEPARARTSAAPPSAASGRAQAAPAQEGPALDPAQMRRLAAELRRWLDAVAAVRQ